MTAFYNVFIANVKEYIRDRATLFWFIVFPLIFVFVFGMAFTGSFEQNFNIGIIVKKDTEFTDKLVKELSSISSFNIYLEKGAGGVELAALKKGERNLVIEIPNISGQDLLSGKNIEIPLYYDASQFQTNQILISVFQQIFSEIELQFSGRKRIFNLADRPIQAKLLSNFDYILPGILAMALMQLGLFGALQFLNLREKKIIRGLGVTPLSRRVLLSSEILLRLVLGLIQTILIVSIGSLVFKVNIVGSIIEVFCVVILGSLTFISLGYMLTSFVKTIEAGNGLIQVVQFPMLFLSGVFFSQEMMPDYIQPLIKVLPLTYLGNALRQVMVGSNVGAPMKTNILVLTGWLLITTIINIKNWKWD